MGKRLPWWLRFSLNSWGFNPPCLSKKNMFIVYLYAHVYIYTYIHIYIYTYIHIYIYTYIHIYIYTYIHIYIYTYIHIYIYTYIHIYIYTYIHIYIYTYICGPYIHRFFGSCIATLACSIRKAMQSMQESLHHSHAFTSWSTSLCSL